MTHGAVVFNEIVLASTSPARRLLMESAGFAFRAIAPGVPEDVPEGMPPQHATALLAERKARAVHAQRPSALVIGADQLVSFQGRMLGKPPNADAAKEQLSMLSGKAHELFTAVCVIGAGFVVTEVDVARLKLWPLNEEELAGYVATGEWQGCAGSYRIEGKGQLLFERIDGDRTSIQGLPMQRLSRILREAGVSFF